MAAGIGPEPAPLSPDDVVPRFRTDLRVQRRSSRGLFDLVDPRSGKRFTLYDFELAVARMLDGRRRASEVVQQGARLGIPIDIDGLYKFVRQMWHYGFLAVGTAPAEGEGADRTWDERERWDEATRTLFQTGLRLMHTGRTADAASYFEAVLDAHPAHPEAAEMLAAIAKGRSFEAKPIGEIPTARERNVPSRRRPLPLGRSVELARSWLIAQRWAALTGVAIALAAAAAAIVLVGHRREPRRAQAGPIGPAAPAVVVSTPPVAPPATPVAAPVAPPVPAPEASPAAAPPVAAPSPEASEPRVRSALVQVRRHPAIVRIVSPASGALRWKVAPGARVNRGARIAEIRIVTSAGGAIHREERTVVILALTAGVLDRPAEDRGRAAKEEVLGRILDPRIWELEASVEGEAPAVNWECEVRGDVAAERASCEVLRAEAKEGEPGHVTFTVEVSSSAVPWLERTSSPQVRVAPAGTAL